MQKSNKEKTEISAMLFARAVLTVAARVRPSQPSVNGDDDLPISVQVFAGSLYGHSSIIIVTTVIISTIFIMVVFNII